MNEKLAKVGLAILALAAIATPVGLLTSAHAQQPGFTQGPPPQFGGPGQGPGGMPMGQGGGMMGGGPATMIDDNNNLYVLRGNTVFKISKGNMRIEGAVELPRPNMPGMQPGQPGPPPGAPGRPGRGGGAGAPPPSAGSTTPPPAKK